MSSHHTAELEEHALRFSPSSGSSSSVQFAPAIHSSSHVRVQQHRGGRFVFPELERSRDRPRYQLSVVRKAARSHGVLKRGWGFTYFGPHDTILSDERDFERACKQRCTWSSWKIRIKFAYKSRFSAAASQHLRSFKSRDMNTTLE